MIYSSYRHTWLPSSCVLLLLVGNLWLWSDRAEHRADSIVAMVKYAGLGRHSAAFVATDPSKLVLFAKMSIVFELAYAVAVTLPRLVLLALYLRISNQRPFRISCYTILGILIFYECLAITLTLTTCVPLSMFWDPTVQGHCFDIIGWWRWSTFPDLLIDAAMLILPIPVIWGLNIPRNDKVGLLLTFSTAVM